MVEISPCTSPFPATRQTPTSQIAVEGGDCAHGNVSTSKRWFHGRPMGTRTVRLRTIQGRPVGFTDNCSEKTSAVTTKRSHRTGQNKRTNAKHEVGTRISSSLRRTPCCINSHTRASASKTSAAAFALLGEGGSRGRTVPFNGRLRLRTNVGSAASVQSGTSWSSSFGSFLGGAAEAEGGRGQSQPPCRRH